MSTYIQNLLENALGDGARSAKFECVLNVPLSELFPQTIDIATLVKSTSYPSKELTTIDLKYKGRNIPIRGQVKYGQTWDCTFYMEENHSLRNAFEVWIEAIEEIHNSDEDAIGLKDLQNQNWDMGYTTTALIAQMNFESDKRTAIYELHNLFPTKVTSPNVGFDEVGKVLEFTVSFSYSHYTLEIFKEKLNFVDQQIANAKKWAQEAVNTAMTSVSDSIAAGITEVMPESVQKSQLVTPPSNMTATLT